MTEEINFIALQNRFNEIKNFYPPKTIKYIHVRTVDNILAHANSFFMKHNKQEIFKALTEYLDIIGSKQIDNITDSLVLYDKYIRPLTNLFSDLRDFHMALPVWIMTLWLVPFYILLYFLKASIYFFVGLAALFILLVARQVYYTRQKKTYGFMH